MAIEGLKTDRKAPAREGSGGVDGWGVENV